MTPGNVLIIGNSHTVAPRVAALRKAMAVCGYESMKDLQKAELVITGRGATS